MSISPTLSDRVNSLAESETLAMSRRSRELRQQGHDVINLSLGEPDFNTPDFIKEAAKKAIDQNLTHYTPVAAYQEVREAISRKFKRDNNLNYAPDQVVVSTGAKQSIANVVLSLINPGDEVLLPVPYWVSYREMVKMAGGTVKEIRSGIKQDFKIDFSRIGDHIGPATRMLIFSSPCNPSGAVFNSGELAHLVHAMKAHPRLIVISDEIYEHINYVGKHVSLASFAEIADRVVTVNGVSKGFAMTGWRVGYIGASKEIAMAAEKIQGQVTSATCSIAQKAAQAAVEADPESVRSMINEFRKRRDLILKLLKEIPGIITNIPDGAFYVFPEVSSYFGRKYPGGVINNSSDLCDYLLNDAHVAMVPGTAFGSPECIRISYAAAEEQIRSAIARISVSLKKLSLN